jgi:hypothetical protein
LGWSFAALIPLALPLLLTAPVRAQQPTNPDHGQVVVSSGQPVPRNPADSDVSPKDPIANSERTAVVILSDDLDLHLTPAESAEEAHAILTLRNDSAVPLTRIPLQLSSTLRWQSIGSVGRSAKPIPFTQSPVPTDTDHTGYAQEAVLTPDHPLAPGATLTLSVFYAGQIPASTGRLELIGTPPDKAAQTDWDAITPTSDQASTALRGFGDVLWYPVAGPVALFGEGNDLFAAVARQRLLNTSTTMRLRLTVVYSGDPPNGVVFDSQLQPLTRTADDPNQVIDNTHGVATATFPMQPIGFRTPNLFITGQNVTQSGSPLLSFITPNPETAEPYTTAAQNLQPFFADWLAPAPTQPLLILEHAGAPFEDAAFIAAHLAADAQPDSIAPELVRPLTHAYFSAPAATSLWLDQGLPEFMSLLWTEHTEGRNTAIGQLQQDSIPLALAEPDLAAHPTDPGTPLTRAGSDVLLHFKSAAVLWQLREFLGDDALRRSIAAFRHSLQLNPQLDRDPTGFEKAVEQTAGVDLAWFFNDWVYNDRGLPDLTVVQAIPRPILGKGGKTGGYLVAVDVRNDGFAAADVPVTVRSGDLAATERLRIPARSVASTRIVFQTTPETLQVNDGSVPELRVSIHILPITVEPKPNAN